MDKEQEELQKEIFNAEKEFGDIEKWQDVSAFLGAHLEMCKMPAS